jgi:MFS family permease
MARSRAVLWIVLIAQLMVVLDATIVTVALPSISTGLHFDSQLQLQWVINAYLCCSAVSCCSAAELVTFWAPACATCRPPMGPPSDNQLGAGDFKYLVWSLKPFSAPARL